MTDCGNSAFLVCDRIGRIWATPGFFILGGGPPVFVSLLFNFVADATPAGLRSSRFFQLEAAAYVGNTLSYVVSSALGM